MAKRLAVAFGLGAAMPLFCALYLGGENLAQAGLRLGSDRAGVRARGSALAVRGDAGARGHHGALGRAAAPPRPWRKSRARRSVDERAVESCVALQRCRDART